jgi:hypothetical protein
MRIDRLTVQNFKKFAGQTFQHLPTEAKANGAARLWVAFYGCFNERIRFGVLHKWFHRETRERAGQTLSGEATPPTH